MTVLSDYLDFVLFRREQFKLPKIISRKPPTKLSPEQIADILYRLAHDEKTPDLAKKYGVSESTIRHKAQLAAAGHY